MSPALTRLAAFMVTFGPALLLMSARPAHREASPNILEATIVTSERPSASASFEQQSCGGSAIGKGWCSRLGCSDGGCSASWSPIPNSRCQTRCTKPSWHCCGWSINTSTDCGCVSQAPEPVSYQCGPCAKDDDSK